VRREEASDSRHRLCEVPDARRPYRTSREGAWHRVHARKGDRHREIVAFGVIATPALVVDGEIKVAGRVPSPEAIKPLLA